jgi:Xaa-Pro aminopeptidase
VEDTLDKDHGQYHRRWMVHGTSHHLGLDVHDCALATREEYMDGVLEPGMVLTVEPGLYIDPERESVTFHLREYDEDEMWERRLRLGSAARKLEEEEKAKAEQIVHPIPPEFRGIGVRIEDDVLVTDEGPDVLTEGTPKLVDEIERVCAETPRWVVPLRPAPR